MASEVVINLKIDTKDGVKSVGSLKKEFSETLSTTREMEEASQAITEALKDTKVGTAQYKQLSKELIKVNTELKNQELALEALDHEQVASELKSVAGGFMDMAGGLALVGSSNKSLEEVVKTFAKVEGATKIVTGAIESYRSMVKLSSTITTAFSTAVNFLANSQVVMATKTAIVTAATWLWNAALAANPVVLVVAAVVGLVAAIGALVAGIIYAIQNIEKLWNGFKKLLGIQSESEKKAIEQEKALTKLHKTRIKNLDEIISKEKQASDARNLAYDREIEILESLGKDASDLIKRRAEEEKKSADKYLIDIKARQKEEVALYNLTHKTKLRTYDGMLKHQMWVAKKGTEEEKKQAEKSVEILKEKAKLIGEADTRKHTATIALNKVITKDEQQLADQREKNAQKYQTYLAKQNEKLEKQKQLQKDLLKQTIDNQDELDRLWFESLEENEAKEKIAIARKYDNLIGNIKANNEQTLELEKAYKEAQNKELSAIDAKYRQAEFEEKQKAIDAENALLFAQSDALIKKQNEDDAKALENQRRTLENFRLASVGVIDAVAGAMTGSFDQINQGFEAISLALTDPENGLIAKIKDGSITAIDAITLGMETAMGVLSAISQATAQRQSEAREREFEEGSEQLKNQLAKREISQKDFENKMALLQQKKDQEERQAKRKAFQQDKANAIVKAIMGTAQAVISGLGAPPPLGFILAGINASLGAVQTGIIASQKFKANRGGVVPGAPSKVDSVDALLAPGEMVINSTSASMFPQLLSSINELGGGVSLAPNLAPKTSNSNSVYQSQQDQRVYVVESDITRTQRRVSRIEQSASFA